MTMNARWDEDDLREDAFNQLRLDVRVAEAPLIALVADLAKTLCTTIAALTLLTRDTVYLYAAHGLTQRQLPRAYALCNQTVRQVGVTAFNDLHAVPGLAGHPLLRQIPKLRFYAGAPLVAPNGAAVGAICVLDERPRILDDDQCHILLLAAATIGSRWLLHGLEQRAELESPQASCGEALLSIEVEAASEQNQDDIERVAMAVKTAAQRHNLQHLRVASHLHAVICGQFPTSAQHELRRELETLLSTACPPGADYPSWRRRLRIRFHNRSA